MRSVYLTTNCDEGVSFCTQCNPLFLQLVCLSLFSFFYLSAVVFCFYLMRLLKQRERERATESDVTGPDISHVGGSEITEGHVTGEALPGTVSDRGRMRNWYIVYCY
jgi:hypothetical protein